MPTLIHQIQNKEKDHRDSFSHWKGIPSHKAILKKKNFLQSVQLIYQKQKAKKLVIYCKKLFPDL